jgi:predicted SnoaL-like aldol condensation-catalyzing enzyme
MTHHAAVQDDEAKRNVDIVLTAPGDLVFTHSIVHGWAPNPVAIVDIFRLENERIVEHWDVVQDIVPAEKSANGNTMV